MTFGFGFGPTGGGGAPSNRSVPVSATATGRLLTLNRLFGSTSTFALGAGTDANLQLDNGDGIKAVAAIGVGNAQVAWVEETAGDGRMVRIKVTCTGAPVAPSVPTITQPSISPGSGTAGSTIFTATDGVPTNGTITAREWLIAGVVVATGGVFAPTSAQSGTLTYRNTVTGPGGTASSTSTSVTIAAATATQGALLAVAPVNGVVATDSGFSPTLTGCCVALTFKGMGRRHPINDPIFDPSSLVLTVQDPGYDVVSGTITPVTRTRTVRGTMPLKCPFPRQWSDLSSSVPARSYCSNTAGGTRWAYYTEAGGTKGATAPSHTTDGQTVSDGGVLWTLVPLGSDTGFVEQLSGSDVAVYAMLDMPIYAGSTIIGVSLSANAYRAGGIASVASSTGAGLAITNPGGVGLPYPSVIPTILTPPHQRALGSIRVEAYVDHAWGMHVGGGRPVAGVRATAWDMARTASVALPDLVDTQLSTLVTAAGPAGTSVEVFPLVFNTSALPAGDAFVEMEFYPWLGVPFRTQFDGEGADWRGNQPYPMVGTIARNGANYYQLTTPGTSAASGGPTGTTLSTDVIDGTCTWTYIGSDNLIQNSRNIPARWHFYNDPADAYKVGHCFVDPAGTATGTSGVFSTFAAADAAKGNLANCYATIFAAEAALATFSNTTTSGKTTHNDSGGGRIWLKAGTHAGIGTSLGGRPRGSVWTYVAADPSAAAGSVIFGNGPVKAGHPRMWFGEGITATATATGTGNIFLDRFADNNATLRQATGELVLSGLNFTGFDSSFGFQQRYGQVWYINNNLSGGVRIADPASQQTAHVLAAGNRLWGSTAIQVWVPNMIGNKMFGVNPVRDTPKSVVPVMFSIHSDNIIVGKTDTVGGCLVNLFGYDASNSTAYPRLGFSMQGNLIKSTNYAGDKCAQIAADGANSPTSNVVISYNSFMGQRYNHQYNDSNQMVHTNWYQGLNVYTSDNTVWDSTGHGGNPRYGAACQNYWSVYDVGSTYNVNLNGSEAGPTPGYNTYSGLRKAATSIQYALGGSITFTSQFVQDTTGVTSSANQAENEGDFRPVAGSAPVNRAAIQAKKYDLRGVARRVDGSGAVGAYERAS